MNGLHINEGYLNFIKGDDISICLSTDYEDNLSKDVKSKRGVYYTDNLVASYMVKRSLEIYIENNRDFNLEKLNKIKVLDPSCGSGAFLIASYRELLKLHMRYNPDFELESTSRYILENNIYGVDISFDALEVVRKRIKMITGGIEIKNLENVDFLTGFELCGFDLIVGNPPYIGEKNNKELFHRIKLTEFGRENYEKGMDYFYYFIEKSSDMVSKNGLVSFITTSYWTKANYGKKLRNKIRNNLSFREVVDFGEYKVFKSAMGQHNMIFYLQKSLHRKKFRFKKIKCNKGKLESKLKELESEVGIEARCCDGNHVFDENECFLFTDKKTTSIIDRIKAVKDCELGDISSINQGLVSGGDRITQRHIDILKSQHDDIAKGEGVFVLSDSELESKGFTREELAIVKKLYKNSNINKYYPQLKTNLNIIYIQRKTDIENYPNIKKHIERYKRILERRREVQNGTIPWYSVHWERKKCIFENQKIIAPQRAYNNIFSYHEGEFYASADVYYITQVRDVSYGYLLALLNSTLAYYWLYYKGKRKGEYLELYQRPLSKIPVKIPDLKTLKEIEIISEKLMDMVKTNNEILNRKYNLSSKSSEKEGVSDIRLEYQSLKTRIDSMIYEVYGLSDEEITTIEKIKDKWL